MHETLYHKFAILHEETALRLTFLFTSFKIGFKPLTFRYGTAGKQLSTSKQMLDLL